MLNEEVVKKLIKKKIKISFAESCTGGMLSKSITSISGSSKIFQLGLVTYSNYSKINILKIPKKSIKKYGAVSKNVCFIMTENVSKISKTNMSASITGIAGPSGGTKNKPVGLVFIGIKRGNRININQFLFKNKGRKFIQKSAVNKCLKLILSAIK